MKITGTKQNRRDVIKRIFKPGDSIKLVGFNLSKCGIKVSRETVREDLRALGLGIPGQRRKSRKSAVEERVAKMLDDSDFAGYERELKFSNERAFRFDFAWPALKIAVEIHGGSWSGGRHTRGAGFQKDQEKHRLAIVLGWRVLPFTSDQIWEVVDTLDAVTEGEERVPASLLAPSKRSCKVVKTR